MMKGKILFYKRVNRIMQSFFIIRKFIKKKKDLFIKKKKTMFKSLYDFSLNFFLMI